MIPPACGGPQTTRPEFTSSAAGPCAPAAEAKAGEEQVHSGAPVTLPAPDGFPTTDRRTNGGESKPVFEVTVHGTPGPQGSKTRNAAGALYESSAKVKPWREAVKSAALDILAYDESWQPIRQAVRLEVVFTLPQPKHHYGTGRNAGVVKPSAPRFPTGKPDTDKLLRSTQDALKDAGVVLDDSVVTDTAAAKRYVLTGVDALSHPGAVIRIRRLNAPSKETEQ
jgi:crossover junction endodeoxyribonuclease RusA